MYKGMIEKVHASYKGGGGARIKGGRSMLGYCLVKTCHDTQFYYSLTKFLLMV